MKKLKKIIQACKLKKKLKAREEREIEKKSDKRTINGIKTAIKEFEEDGGITLKSPPMYEKYGWITLRSPPMYFFDLTFENKITEDYIWHRLDMSDNIECEFYRLENAKEGQRLWREFLSRNADKIAENIKIKQMKNNL